MIPVQDVVPTGRPPLATIALVAINIAWFVAPMVTGERPDVPAAWHADDVVTFVAAIVYLWVFGDNVEARLGRWTLLVTFGVSACVAVVLSDASGLTTTAPGVALAGAVSGVIGAYFLLLPNSRVLMLVPAPPTMVEVPAIFFFGLWWVLQFLTFVVAPAAARSEFGGAQVMWGLAAAVLLGAAVARLTRRPVSWT